MNHTDSIVLFASPRAGVHVDDVPRRAAIDRLEDLVRGVAVGGVADRAVGRERDRGHVTRARHDAAGPRGAAVVRALDGPVALPVREEPAGGEAALRVDELHRVQRDAAERRRGDRERGGREEQSRDDSEDARECREPGENVSCGTLPFEAGTRPPAISMPGARRSARV